MSNRIPTYSWHYRTPASPIVFPHDGKLVTTSDAIAHRFDKRHDHVIRDIRTLISHDNSCAPNFGFTSRKVEMPRGGFREAPYYVIDRDGFALLVMGFTGSKALEWKRKFLDAFKAMESELPGNPVAKWTEDTDVLSAPVKTLRHQPHLIDQFDQASDMLRTCQAALDTKGGVDGELLLSVRATMEAALKIMAPVRAFVNDDI